MNFNRVILGGRLTNDPVTKTLPSGQSVTEFGLATSEIYYDKQEQKVERTTFVDCTSFGPKGETIAKFLQRGRNILLEGRLRLDKWETPEGDKRSKLYVVVDQFEFADGPKKDETEGAEEPTKTAPAAKTSRVKAPF